MNTLTALIAAGALALTAGPAAAHSTITMDLKPNFSAPVSCSEDEIGFGLDIQSLSGRPLGTGQTCARIAGCDPFVPFCRKVAHARFRFDLARGSLTARATLLEVWPTESSFIQLGQGQVTGRTGGYAGATGSLTGGGTGSFDDQFNFTGRLVYVARVS
jgi:hypothetical protein